MSPLDQFFEANVRLEQVIYLPGAVIDCTPNVFREFCEDMPEKAEAALYQQLPVLADFADAEDEIDHEEVAERLLTTPGFLIEAATPCRYYRAEGECSYSWGNYWTAWLYAASEADIVRVALEWAAERDAEDAAKIKAEA